MSSAHAAASASGNRVISSRRALTDARRPNRPPGFAALRLRRAARTILDDAPDCADAVAPADLLAFLVSAARIRNADLVDAAPHRRDLAGHFRLEAEAVFFDRDRLNDFPAEHLVAGFHVGQIQVRERV